MKPEKVVRGKINRFTDLPNIGPASAQDFVLLGYSHPEELVGADPLELYKALCRKTNSYQDPCVLDVFISVVDFLDGKDAQPWWVFTEQRKKNYGDLRLLMVRS